MVYLLGCNMIILQPNKYAFYYCSKMLFKLAGE